MKKILSLILIIFISGCVSKPTYFEKVYSNSPNRIPNPAEGNSMVVFNPNYPKFVRIDSFNGQSITGFTRNGINAAEFRPQKARLEVGLYHRYGELNFVKEVSGYIEYDFEANGKYHIFYSSYSNTFIIRGAIKGKGTAQALEFKGNKL